MHEHYRIDERTGCWLWTGGLTDGYANPTYAMKRDGFTRAHRWYYARAHGVCPDTLDHICKNRACVNPNHLTPCSRGENVRRGDVAKQTWQVVAEMREMARAIAGSQREKARQVGAAFDVPASTVRGILRNSRWPEEVRP